MLEGSQPALRSSFIESLVRNTKQRVLLKFVARAFSGLCSFVVISDGPFHLIIQFINNIVLEKWIELRMERHLPDIPLDILKFFRVDRFLNMIQFKSTIQGLEPPSSLPVLVMLVRYWLHPLPQTFGINNSVRSAKEHLNEFELVLGVLLERQPL